MAHNPLIGRLCHDHDVEVHDGSSNGKLTGIYPIAPQDKMQVAFPMVDSKSKHIITRKVLIYFWEGGKMFFGVCA